MSEMMTRAAKAKADTTPRPPRPSMLFKTEDRPGQVSSFPKPLARPRRVPKESRAAEKEKWIQKHKDRVKTIERRQSMHGNRGSVGDKQLKKVEAVMAKREALKPQSALDATDASAEKGSEENESGKIAKVKAKRWTTRKNKVSAKENVAEPAPDAVVEKLEAKVKELETELDELKSHYEAKLDANLTRANQRIAEKEAEIAALEKKLRRAPVFEGNESEELEKVRAKCAKCVKKIECLAKEKGEYLKKIAALNAELEDLRAPQPESAIPETEGDAEAAQEE